MPKLTSTGSCTNWQYSWFEAKQNEVAAEVADLFSKYRLSEALMAVYKLFWDEFSSWYLEMIKPAYGQPINRKVYEATIGFFDNVACICSIRSCHLSQKSCGSIFATVKTVRA